MDGRDIGSVIFPNADFRFFLHADPAERTRRRAREGQNDAVAERDRTGFVPLDGPLSLPGGGDLDRLDPFDDRPRSRIEMAADR